MFFVILYHLFSGFLFLHDTHVLSNWWSLVIFNHLYLLVSLISCKWLSLFFWPTTRSNTRNISRSFLKTDMKKLIHFSPRISALCVFSITVSSDRRSRPMDTEWWSIRASYGKSPNPLIKKTPCSVNWMHFSFY